MTLGQIKDFYVDFEDGSVIFIENFKAYYDLTCMIAPAWLCLDLPLDLSMVNGIATPTKIIMATIAQFNLKKLD